MIPYIELHINEHCNLRCRGCSHFSVFAKESYKDLGDFRREMKRLSEIEDVQIIRLMGGEPLLNPDWMEYVRITRHYFPSSKVVLVTNGLLGGRIAPHANELNDLNIDITISNYHIERQNISHALKYINFSEVHEKGNLYNISLTLYPSMSNEVAFSLCDLQENHWHYFADGRMYPCCIAGTIKTFWEHFNLDFGFNQEECGIDIFTHTAEEIEEFINKPCKLCAYCRTDVRRNTYQPFSISKGDVKEWTV